MTALILPPRLDRITMNEEIKVLPSGLWRDEDTGTIGMDRCPKCNRENYCMNVLRGICTWCGYDANKEYGITGHKVTDRQNAARSQQ